MKICYIAPSGSVHTEHWVKYFAEVGHEVYVVSSSVLPFRKQNEKAHLHILQSSSRMRLLNYFQKFIQFRKLIKQIKPEVVHGQSISPLTILGVFARRFCPFVVTVWGSDVLVAPKKSKLFKFIVKTVLKKADIVTCDADHIKAPLSELGAETAKIKLIYFGTDTQKFNPAQKRGEFRQRLGVLDKPVVISLRRLEPIYNVETFIRAIPLVLKESADARFVIGSKGSQDKYLKELAMQLGVIDSISFVGYVPDEELPIYLASSDIYVSTSLSDAGLAASTAEAMASGLPVIITDFGDNSKWVKDGVNGFLFALRDYEALASKIIYLLENKDKRKKFGVANRAIIEQRCNWHKEMHKMEKLYEELL